MNLQEMKTVSDLQKYAYEQASSVVADLFNGALRFFMAECTLSGGKRDKKAIKNRRMMGLKFRLQEHHELTVEICEAIKNWMLFYGRNIGTDLISAQLSKAQGVGDPREEAFNVLNTLIQSLTGKEDKSA